MNVHVLLIEADDFTEQIPYSQSSLTFTSDTTRCPVSLDSHKRRFNVMYSRQKKVYATHNLAHYTQRPHQISPVAWFMPSCVEVTVYRAIWTVNICFPHYRGRAP
jgi:hypothetical protein